MPVIAEPPAPAAVIRLASNHPRCVEPSKVATRSGRPGPAPHRANRHLPDDLEQVAVGNGMAEGAIGLGTPSSGPKLQVRIPFIGRRTVADFEQIRLPGQARLLRPGRPTPGFE